MPCGQYNGHFTTQSYDRIQSNKRDKFSSSQNWLDEAGKGSDLADLVYMRKKVDYGVQDIKGDMCYQGDQFCKEALNLKHKLKKKLFLAVGVFLSDPSPIIVYPCH